MSHSFVKFNVSISDEFKELDAMTLAVIINIPIKQIIFDILAMTGATPKCLWRLISLISFIIAFCSFIFITLLDSRLIYQPFAVGEQPYISL